MRKSFANMGVPKADQKRQGFNFVASLRMRVARGVSAATACGAATAGVCRTPRDDTIEAVTEALRIPAQGAGPTVTLFAEERERVLWRFVNMFFEHVSQCESACSTGSLFSASDATLLRHL